jgi:cysteine synthase A
MSVAVQRAAEIMRETERAFMPSQFKHPEKPRAHEEATAVEILDQAGGDIDAFVAGARSGVTSTGVGRVLREKLGKKVSLVAVEPAASAVLSGKPAGMHGIQGLGAGFVPELLDRKLIDKVIQVTDVAAERMVRRLAREEGLLVGPSSGANVHAACEVAASLGKGNVVTVLCDSGERYLF